MPARDVRLNNDGLGCRLLHILGVEALKALRYLTLVEGIILCFPGIEEMTKLPFINPSYGAKLDFPKAVLLVYLRLCVPKRISIVLKQRLGINLPRGMA